MRPSFCLACLAAILLLLTGCLDNPTTEARLACLNLSSYSFTSVPKCQSQDECFSEVQKKLGFDESPFEVPTRGALFESRNRLARSWLFLNRARENLDNIHQGCSSNDYSGIPREVNELNSSLQQSAKEIDSFNSAAARTINAELTVLEMQDINLMPEERVFDDYILLNQNVVDFSQNNVSGNTYASVYLREYGKFSAIAQAIGTQDTLHETTLFGIVSQNKKTISDEVLSKAAKERDFPVALLSAAFGGIADFLRDFFALGGSVESLKSAPSFEAFSALNNIVGSENSAASKFFTIFSSESESLQLLRKSNAETENSVALLMDTAREKGSGISKALAAHNKLSQYFSRGQGFTLAESHYAANPEDFSEAYQSGLAELESALRTLKEQQYLGTTTLGRATSTLKQIKTGAERLIAGFDEFSWLDSESSSQCSAAIAGIKERLGKEEFSSGNTAILSLKARILSKIPGPNEQLSTDACISVLQDFNRLLSYMDGTAPEEKASLLIAQCLEAAEKLLTFDPSGDAKTQLDSMMRIQRPYEDPETVLNACTSLNGRLLRLARENPQVHDAETNFAELEKHAGILKALQEKFPGLTSSGNALQLYSEYSIIAQKFGDGRLSEGHLLLAAHVNQEVSTALEKSGQLIPKLSSQAVEKNAKIQHVSPVLAVFAENAQAQALVKISFASIPTEIPFAFSATLPISSDYAREAFSTGNMSFSPSGTRTTLISFSRLLAGENSIVLDLNAALPQKPRARDPDSSDHTLAAQKIIAEKNSILSNKDSGLGDSGEAGLLGEKIELLAQQERIQDASHALGQLRELSEAAAEKSAADAKAVAEEYSAKLARITKLRASLNKSASEILSAFAKLDRRSAEELLAFTPISQARVQELQAISQDSLPNGENFAALFKKGLFNEAVQEAQSRGVDLALARLEAADQEASAALQKLRENALSSYENARLTIQQSGNADKQVQEYLVGAKSALDRKSYLESLAGSRKAASLVTLPGAAGHSGLVPEIPIAVYPLLLVIAVAGFFALRKKGQQKEEPVRIRKLPDTENDEVIPS